MSISNLFEPNDMILFAKSISLSGGIDTNNRAFQQFGGKIITTTTAVTVLTGLLLADGKYILILCVSGNTTAGPGLNGGILQVLTYWLNVVDGILTIDSTVTPEEHRYIYDNASNLGATVTVGGVDNLFLINVQNAYVGNTTTWEVIAQLYGFSNS